MFCDERLTIVCGIVLPMNQTSAESVIHLLKVEARAQILGDMREDATLEVCACFCFRAVPDSDNLAVLHYIELAKPSLIERVAGRMDNVAEPVLLSKYQHRVEQAFHRLDGLNETRPRVQVSMLIRPG